MFPVRRAPVRAGQGFPEGPSGLQLGEPAEIMVMPSLYQSFYHPFYQPCSNQSLV